LAHTILLNFLVAALVFILISRKLFSFIKARLCTFWPLSSMGIDFFRQTSYNFFKSL